MVTAANDPATLEETMHLGVIDFLIKPFAYERFQVALEKFMMNAEAFRAAKQTIDQSYVDNLISNQLAGHQAEADLPKGIQKKTLDLLTGYFSEKNGWVSGEQISADVGLSCVTVRHYMAYLVEIKKIKSEINYSSFLFSC
jgi:response regulator of citrate/malate metabolism